MGGGCSGCVVWHLKSIFTDELFAVSRNSLALGGAVSPVSAKPREVKVAENQRHGEYLIALVRAGVAGQGSLQASGQAAARGRGPFCFSRLDTAPLLGTPPEPQGPNTPTPEYEEGCPGSASSPSQPWIRGLGVVRPGA